MPIHIRRHDKSSTSTQKLDISLLMNGNNIFLQASYMDTRSVFGLLYGSV